MQNELTDSFSVYDDKGNEHTVLEFTEIHEVRGEKLRGFKTCQISPDGPVLNRLSDTEFEDPRTRIRYTRR